MLSGAAFVDWGEARASPPNELTGLLISGFLFSCDLGAATDDVLWK